MGDAVFSYAFGKIQAVGVVEKKCEDTVKPVIFENIGEYWNKDGWLVQIRWSILEKPLIPRSYIDKIAPLLPTKNSPIQKTGVGNQKCYLASISKELGQYLLKLYPNNKENIDSLIEDAAESLLDDIEERNIIEMNIPSVEKQQMIKARRGQGLFRLRVEKLEAKCRITGVSDKRFLIASHIKPWRLSDVTEKLDGNNGLLLSPHVDKLFDKGWISFLDNGTILYENDMVLEIFKKWGIDADKNVGSFNASQRNYLSFHRENIFKKTAKSNCETLLTR